MLCALCPMAREATLAMLDILSETPPSPLIWTYQSHRERIERVSTADNALKYVEFATKAATNPLQFEEIQNYAEAITLQRYTAVCGHLAYSPWGIPNGQGLILQENRIATKQTAPQRDLPECSAAISRRSSPSLRAIPGCLSQITLFSMWQPSVPAKKVAKLVKRDALCILCGDVPVDLFEACVLVMHRRNAKSAKSGF